MNLKHKLLIAAVMAALLGAGVQQYMQPGQPPAEKCADGTLLNQCSAMKPQYCMNGALADRCDLCNCHTGEECNTTSGSCRKQTEIELLGNVEVNVPDPLLFSPSVYSASLPGQLQIAFVEIEPSNSAGIEITETSFSQHVQAFKEYMEEISGGKQEVDARYTVLPKETVGRPIGLNYSEFREIAQPVFDKYRNDPSLRGHILVAYIDAFDVATALNLGGSADNVFQILFVSRHYNDSKTFGTSLAHELLHTAARAKDAYDFCRNTFPLINYRQDDLYGWGWRAHPFGQIKAQMGWNNYNIINPRTGSEIMFDVNNSCLPGAKIVKIPLGYVVDDTRGKNTNYVCNSLPKLMLKSMIIELRGKNVCKYEKRAGVDDLTAPGVWLFQTYETKERVEYSHQIPWKGTGTSPDNAPNYFALVNTSPYLNYDQYRLANISTADFDFRILDETWSNGSLDSSKVAFTLKGRESDSALRNARLNVSAYNAGDYALVIRVDSNYEGLYYRISISPADLAPIIIPTISQPQFFCIYNRTTPVQDADAFCRDATRKISGISEPQRNIYRIESSSQNLELAVSNFVNENKMVVRNFLG